MLLYCSYLDYLEQTFDMVTTEVGSYKNINDLIARNICVFRLWASPMRGVTSGWPGCAREAAATRRLSGLMEEYMPGESI